jgi:hypothetical protein
MAGGFADTFRIMLVSARKHATRLRDLAKPAHGRLREQDVLHLQTWWQLHLGGSIEYALGGWWNTPILQVEHQDAFVREKMLDLIRTLRETPDAYRSRF